MNTQEYQKSSQFIPSLPDGTDPNESIWGLPEFAPGEAGVTSKIFNFYKGYWESVGKILTGKGADLIEQKKIQDQVGTIETAPSVGWVFLLAVAAGAVYFFKGRG